MTKKSLWLPVVALAIVAPGFLYAQTTDTPPPAQDYGIKFSGFVKIDAFNDDHTVVGARQDMFLLYPGQRSQITAAPGGMDPTAALLYVHGNKTDLNAHGQTVFTGVQTRLTGKITGPDAFGAKVTGLIEGDFFGYPFDANIANFGVRHAWINLDWGSTNFRIGQDWHPLFSAGGVNPNTIQFNPIAPIHPFGRAPQVALTQKMGDVKLSLYAIEQSYHIDSSPNGADAPGKPLANNQIPEVAAQLVYDANGITVGGTADYKSLKPMDATNPAYAAGVGPATVGNNSNTMKSTTYQAFLKIKAGEATFKASTTMGGALQSTTGRWGYAVKRDYVLESIDAGGGSAADQTLAQTLAKREYLPLRSRGVWAEFDYGKDVEFGIVGGMVRNLGATSAIVNATGTTNGADNLRQVSTVATHVKFTSGKTWIGLEYIYSAAQYMEDDKGYKAIMSAALAANGLGTTYNKLTVNGNALDNPAVRDDRGRINNWYTVADHRIQLSVNQSF